MLGDEDAPRQQAFAKPRPKFLAIALVLHAVGKRDLRLLEDAIIRPRQNHGLVELELLAPLLRCNPP